MQDILNEIIGTYENRKKQLTLESDVKKNKILMRIDSLDKRKKSEIDEYIKLYSKSSLSSTYVSTIRKDLEKSYDDQKIILENDLKTIDSQFKDDLVKIEDETIEQLLNAKKQMEQDIVGIKQGIIKQILDVKKQMEQDLNKKQAILDKLIQEQKNYKYVYNENNNGKFWIDLYRKQDEARKNIIDSNENIAILNKLLEKDELKLNDESIEKEVPESIKTIDREFWMNFYRRQEEAKRSILEVKDNITSKLNKLLENFKQVDEMEELEENKTIEHNEDSSTELASSTDNDENNEKLEESTTEEKQDISDSDEITDENLEQELHNEGSNENENYIRKYIGPRLNPNNDDLDKILNNNGLGVYINPPTIKQYLKKKLMVGESVDDLAKTIFNDIVYEAQNVSAIKLDNDYKTDYYGYHLSTYNGNTREGYVDEHEKNKESYKFNQSIGLTEDDQIGGELICEISEGQYINSDDIFNAFKQYIRKNKGQKLCIVEHIKNNGKVRTNLFGKEIVDEKISSKTKFLNKSDIKRLKKLLKHMIVLKDEQNEGKMLYIRDLTLDQVYETPVTKISTNLPSGYYISVDEYLSALKKLILDKKNNWFKRFKKSLLEKFKTSSSLDFDCVYSADQDTHKQKKYER